MSTWVWIVIVIVAVAVLALAATAIARRRRSAMLRQRFGPEYDRTLAGRDSQRAAEAELLGRERQRSRLDIKPLPEASRMRYTEEWRGVQERFVDQPAEAAAAADALIYQVMAERGYPMGDFSAQADLVSVDHPDVAENYRVAHTIHERARAGQASTEDLREALLRYRSLFEELVRDGGAPASSAGEPAAAADGAAAGPGGTGPGGAAQERFDDGAALPGQSVRVGPAAGEHPAATEAGDDLR